MNLMIVAGDFSICRLEPGQATPDWVFDSGFHSVTKTPEETSIVCRSDRVPEGIEMEKGWRGIEVEGPLAFNQIGILASLLQPLAEARIPVFVLSTYLTDYLFLKEQYLPDAIEVLRYAGHHVLSDPPHK